MVVKFAGSSVGYSAHRSVKPTIARSSAVQAERRLIFEGQKSAVIAVASPMIFGLHCQGHQSECVDIGPTGRMSRRRRLEVAHMRGRKNPPLEITPLPDGSLLTFDTMAQAYLEDYVLQRYRTLTTARARVEHLRGFFGGWAARGDDARQRAQLPVAPPQARR